MDEFERELRELMNERVAEMPDGYEIAPDLVVRAHRRRATKRIALVVAVVVVASGTTAAVAQVAGRHGPDRIVTNPDTSTSASVPSTSSTPTSTSVPTAAPASVPTVACPILYAITSDTPLPPPSKDSRVVTGASIAAVAGLASYAATTDDRYIVLAPKGWSCQTTIAADGQNGMGLWNPALGPPKPYYDSGPIQVLDDFLWHGGVGSAVACSVFDDSAVVQYMTQNYPELLPCPKAGRTVTRIDANTATFVDADGTRGGAIMALPSGSTQDDGTIRLITCQPVDGLSVADCDTIIADFMARNPVPGEAANAPTATLAAAPFRPGDWATTTNGVVITDGGSHELAAYDAGTADWHTLPAPPISGQPWIFATRGNDVFVTTQPASDSATSTPFAVLDVGSGAWRTLAPVPDRVFGKLDSAGDADHLFGFGAFDDDYLNRKFTQHEVAVEYDIATNRWSTLPAPPLSERSGAVLQWTGHELVVWSGGDYHQGGGPGYDDGAAYAPATGRWRTLPAAPVSGRIGAASVWTGTEMLVWGGSDCTGCGTGAVGAGAAYNPTTDQWRKLSTSPLQATEAPAAIWTGTEMIVLGGSSPGVPAAAAYDPTSDRWGSLPPPPASARAVLGSAAKSYGSWVGGFAIFGVLGASPKPADFTAFSYVLGG